MSKNISFMVDADVYEKFNIALNLTGETSDEAADACLRWYIAQAFGNASKEYIPKTGKLIDNIDKDFYGKATQRIPMWALKPNQYNHKIIKAYFMAIDIEGEATLLMMERLCSDKERPDLFVPTFRNNYSQMKLDGPKSHGKVFEDDGERVWVWDEVEKTLMKYKSSFYVEEE
ncbi:hypothetical protein [Clostridium sp.]|uniref:hypothetical protein n=1 Tax=Clostridium sp. TaxID=1506 RepID=UPI003217CC47